MKTKLFTHLDKNRDLGQKLEEDINDFLKKTWMEDIKYQISHMGILKGCNYSAIVFYSEQNDEKAGERVKIITHSNSKIFEKKINEYINKREGINSTFIRYSMTSIPSSCESLHSALIIY